MDINIKASSLETLPRRDFREVGFYLGDAREIAKRIGATIQVKRNDLGDYFVIELLLDEVPVKLVGLVPFAAEEFAIVSDPEEAVRATVAVRRLFSEIGYSMTPVEAK